MFFNRRCLSIVLAFVTFKIISLSAQIVAKVTIECRAKIIFANTLFINILEMDAKMGTEHESMGGFEDSAGNYFGYSWIG